MKALFLILETQDGIKVQKLDGEYKYMKNARKELSYQLNILASKKDANQTQPTMNFKDRFHFWIKDSSQVEEKRHIVISNYYKSENRSLRMKQEAIDKISDRRSCMMI